MASSKAAGAMLCSVAIALIILTHFQSQTASKTVSTLSNSVHSTLDRRARLGQTDLKVALRRKLRKLYRPKRPNPRCSGGPVRGRCRGRFIRYYYDSKTKRCRRFVYGGCRGSANRFNTKASCMRACGHQSSGTTTKPSGGKCSGGPVTGPCRARFTRYYFDTKKRRCRRFVYGGCRGSANRYRTKSACDETCNPTSRRPKRSRKYNPFRYSSKKRSSSSRRSRRSRPSRKRRGKGRRKRGRMDRKRRGGRRRGRMSRKRRGRKRRGGKRRDRMGRKRRGGKRRGRMGRKRRGGKRRGRMGRKRRGGKRRGRMGRKRRGGKRRSRKRRGGKRRGRMGRKRRGGRRRGRMGRKRRGRGYRLRKGRKYGRRGVRGRRSRRRGRMGRKRRDRSRFGHRGRMGRKRRGRGRRGRRGRGRRGQGLRGRRRRGRGWGIRRRGRRAARAARRAAILAAQKRRAERRRRAAIRRARKQREALEERRKAALESRRQREYLAFRMMRDKAAAAKAAREAAAAEKKKRMIEVRLAKEKKLRDMHTSLLKRGGKPSGIHPTHCYCRPQVPSPNSKCYYYTQPLTSSRRCAYRQCRMSYVCLNYPCAMICVRKIRTKKIVPVGDGTPNCRTVPLDHYTYVPYGVKAFNPHHMMHMNMQFRG